MFRPIYRALLLLSLGLISHAFTLGFSDSQQCGSVEVAWARRADAAEQFQYPFYLYVVPFNSTATIQEIHNWDASTPSGSARLDFLLPASSPYILGVVDSQGRGVGASSEVLVTQNSTNTSCLSSQRQQQLSQFQAIPTTEPSECPSVSLLFNPPNQPPRALVFSPGERPRDMGNTVTSATFRTGFIRLFGFTSFSQAVVVYQENKTSPAYTSSLLTVGGADSIRCGASLSSVPSRPPALEGGSVIGYAFAAVVLTGLITTSCLYLYNLRVEMMKPPCPPPKDYFILTQRRSTPRDMDLEAACLIPLPPSTTSLVSPSLAAINRSVASFAIPEPPYTTPVSPQPSISNLNHTEETVRPIVRNQTIQPNEPSSGQATLSPSAYRHYTSPSVYSVVTKRSSQPKRHSDASTYPHSTRPSTFVSGTRESATLSFSEAITARFTPRPDSPTLPDIQTTSPFLFNFDIARSSKGSSKKSEKRSMYSKMEDVKEDMEEGADISRRRRARSLSRSRSTSSHKSKKKARSVPR